jgi:hypothetical protein
MYTEFILIDKIFILVHFKSKPQYGIYKPILTQRKYTDRNRHL